MPYGKDEAGNVWELDAQGNPTRLHSPATQQVVAPDPMKQQAAQLGNEHTGAEIPQVQAQTAKTQEETRWIPRLNQAELTAKNATAQTAQIAAQKAQRELQDQQQADHLKKAAEGMNSDEILSAIARAKDLTGWNTAGVLSPMMKNIGGTDAADLAAQLSTIAAGTTLNKLAALKAQSATGASGLGQLSNREGELLRDSVAPLGQYQSPGALIQNLDKVEQHYRKMNAINAGGDPRKPLVQQQFGMKVPLNPDGANSALAQGFQSLTQQMQGKTPAQRQAMLQAFNSNPDIQDLKKRAGFVDPGAPRKAVDRFTPEQRAAAAKYNLDL